jgi:cyclohexa-1,5-dienecarbonyl-CoA hydratase
MPMAEDIESTQDIDVYASRTDWTPQFVKFTVDKGIATIALNRPPANVLSIEAMEDVNRALEALEYRREVKLIVMRGEGKYFSAGLELNDHLGDRGYVMLEACRRIFDNLAKTDKPSLAVVAGPALGAGSLLAGACDITLAAASAKFGHPEIKGGVFNAPAAVLLPRLVGRKRAIEMLFGGASIGAAEAERIGLITRAVPDDKLEAEAAALIQRFAEMSAVVAQFTRAAIAGALDHPFTEAMRHAENVYLNQLMTSEDAAEGLRAVLEKRKPAWKDR